MSLLTQDADVELSGFLMGDAVSCAKAGQKTLDAYYNLERMLKPIVCKGGAHRRGRQSAGLLTT